MQDMGTEDEKKKIKQFISMTSVINGKKHDLIFRSILITDKNAINSVSYLHTLSL